MKEEKSNVFINLKKIIKYIIEIDRRFLIISITSVVINGASPALSLILMQEIINLIQIGNNFNIIIKYTAIHVLLELFIDLYNNYLIFYNTRFTMKFTTKLSEIILIKSSKLSLSSYEDSNTYDIINRAQNEDGNKLLGFYNNIVTIITNCITLISFIIILSRFRYWIVFPIASIPILKYFTNSKYNKISFKNIKFRTNNSRKSWYINYLLTYGNFYKELKTYNLYNYFIDSYKKLIQGFQSEDLKVLKSRVLSFSILSFFELIIQGVIFIYIIFLGLNGFILIGNVLTYTKSINNSKKSISSVLLDVSNLIKDSLFINQLFEYLEIPEIDNEGKIKIKNIFKIELKNVSYKYPKSNKYSIDNVNLTITTNETVALVGRNGSGKTTLIKIIMGFYDQYEGEVLINNIDLKKIDKNSLLFNISTLFQDYIKYEATLKENIVYGDISNMNEFEKIKDSINTFNLNEIIEESNKGIETQLGTWFDEGINLSTGQWQKLALARAFYKNSDVYILDEPNAALDLITEREINQLYNYILKNRIGIIITHKLNSIVKSADKIIVFEDGRITQKGTHEELIKSEGLYNTLYNLEM